MTLLWDSWDPVIRTVQEKVSAQQLAHVKPAVFNLFLSPVFLPGQGAITLHCLQRTPDQTITLSGSQTPPKGFDSTDKWAPGPPSHWGERDHTPFEQRQHRILKTSFLQFHYIRQAVSTATLLPPRNLKGSKEVKWKCAFFSPHSKSVDTVIMDIFWTHCDDPFKKRFSFSPQPLCLRTPSRWKQRLEQRRRDRT